MKLIDRILHLIPFIHRHTTWSDICDIYGGRERQQRFCKVCNSKQYRTVDNV